MGGSCLELARVAQTNIALYRQMHRSGYAQDALTLVRDAYELATELFTGRYRATGKPFVCHLVGTASVLVTLRAAPEIVAAGLLHAAYDTNQHTGRVTASRERVSSALGEAVEQHVYAYRQFKWDLARMRTILDEGLDVAHKDAQTLLIRLANEVDDHLDDSMAYCSSLRRHIDAGFPYWIEMAERLDHPMLADALRALLTEQADSDWTRPLALDRTASYPIASPRVGWPRRIVTRMRSSLRALYRVRASAQRS